MVCLGYMCTTAKANGMIRISFKYCLIILCTVLVVLLGYLHVNSYCEYAFSHIIHVSASKSMCLTTYMQKQGSGYPALRTRDGGLRSFVASQLSPHTHTHTYVLTCTLRNVLTNTALGLLHVTFTWKNMCIAHLAKKKKKQKPHPSKLNQTYSIHDWSRTQVP